MLMSSVNGNFSMELQASEHEHAITCECKLIQQLEFDDLINDFTEGQKRLAVLVENLSLQLCAVLSCAVVAVALHYILMVNYVFFCNEWCKILLIIPIWLTEK